MPIPFKIGENGALKVSGSKSGGGGGVWEWLGGEPGTF